VAIEVAHIAFAPGDASMLITLPQSKMDRLPIGDVLQ